MALLTEKEKVYLNLWHEYVHDIEKLNEGAHWRFQRIPTLKGYCVNKLKMSEKAFRKEHSEEFVDYINDLGQVFIEDKLSTSANTNLKFLYEQYGNSPVSIAQQELELKRAKFEAEKERFSNASFVFIDDSEYLEDEES